MRRELPRLMLVALCAAFALSGGVSASFAQDPAPALPAAEDEAAPAAATAIPKPAATTSAPDAPAAKPKPKKTAKKAVSCDGLFEAACKEIEKCAWAGGAVGSDGQPGKSICVQVDKTAAKGTKDSCPAMFEALCRETKGCDWTAGAPGADGAAASAGSCTFIGKGKKAAAAATAKPAAAAPPPPPDTFGDQQ